jgi:phenylalanyl-tRNA synthetase beta chain
MTLRESRKGEKIETLDGKEFNLPGGDIVIEDGEGNLIDLCGVMGGEASAIDEDTENVLLFVQTYDPIRIRKTSMSLAQRTMAATIFEKGTDPELVSIAILSAIDLFKKFTGGTVDKNILNLYPNPYKTKVISTNLKFIYERLGVEISKKDISSYLNSLEFKCSWKGDNLSVEVPSPRAKDVNIEEDILEEIARIYGYHNLPSKIMSGEIPTRPESPQFAFETKIRNILAGLTGTEVYTLSLVPKESVDEKSLRLKNPLGVDTEYLRTSLMPSLVAAAYSNISTVGKFHLFELSNVYIPRPNDLPVEKLMLAGIFHGYTNYRDAKGVVEALLEKLNVQVTFVSEDQKGFDASRCAIVKSKSEIVGKIGYVEGSDFIYYEFDIEKIFKIAPTVTRFRGISKYPAQEEDITFVIPERTEIGKVCDLIKSIHFVQECSVGNPYNGNNFTFHIWYHDNSKTLTDKEVEKVRREIISSVKSKFGASIKE